MKSPRGTHFGRPKKTARFLADSFGSDERECPPRIWDHAFMSIKDIKSMRARSDWTSAKLIQETRGITAPQLRRYAADGLIRTSNILRPGYARGTRLYNVVDLDTLIERSIQNTAAGGGPLKAVAAPFA